MYDLVYEGVRGVAGPNAARCAMVADEKETFTREGLPDSAARFLERARLGQVKTSKGNVLVAGYAAAAKRGFVERQRRAEEEDALAATLAATVAAEEAMPDLGDLSDDALALALGDCAELPELPASQESVASPDADADVDGEAAELEREHKRLRRAARTAQLALRRATKAGDGDALPALREAAADAMRVASESCAAAAPSQEDHIWAGREHDDVLNLMATHPAVRREAEAAASRQGWLTAKLEELMADSQFQPMSVAERQAKMCERARASGVSEALLDLEPPSRPATAATFAVGPGDGRGLLPALPSSFFEHRESDVAVGELLLRTKFGLPTAQSADVDIVQPGVSRFFWEAPSGTMNPYNEPCWRVSDHEALLCEPSAVHRQRLERRDSSLLHRAKRDVFGELVLPEPPTCAADVTPEGRAAMFAQFFAASEKVAGSGRSVRTDLGIARRLNTWEGFLRMYGMTLQNLTTRGVPEEVRGLRWPG